MNPAAIRRAISDALHALAVKITAKLETLAASLRANRQRRVTVDLADIAIGVTPVNITWTPPIPGPYSAIPTFIAGGATLGLLFGAVKPNSKTPSGCTINVANTGLAVITAAGLDVLIVPDPS